MQRNMQTCHECRDILSEENRYHYRMKSGKAEKPSIPQLCLQTLQATSCELTKHAYEITPAAAVRNAVRVLQSNRQTFPGPLPRKGANRPEKSFRGFICKVCNSSIGGLGDCEQGVERALKYLKKANEQRDNAIVEEAVVGERVPEHNPAV